MTTIKTTCDHCGEIHLGPSDIASGDSDLSIGKRQLPIRVPRVLLLCRGAQQQARVVSILLATGVSYEVSVEPDWTHHRN